MKLEPLVSVLIPTKNSADYIEACLRSIVQQTYKRIEIIVVDNFSNDRTLAIAKNYTTHIYSRGPERSAQVNYGASHATGEYIYKVDSDFTLNFDVIRQCVSKVIAGYDAVVVHNSPDVSVSWIAKVRKFEVDMYKGDLTHSSARFVRKEVYKAIGGFNETITAGEDYDFQNKLNRCGYKTTFIDAEALHHGEPRFFWKHMKKYFLYGRDFVNYKHENQDESSRQLGLVRLVYVKNWKKFVRSPMIAILFIIYAAIKHSFGAAGYVVEHLSRMKSRIRKIMALVQK
jgi:glycosyltransferase involved in cell wall biosynthesis